ncbi:asparagine synthase (glutamine-hydrolyzing) [Candidatus Altiarchaeota archaeon]
MCGICGIYGLGDKEIIKAMSSVLAHRGPDDEGFYVDKEISLGHRRLSIIDLSEKGRQPMSNEDGSIWVVYNGEIYNHLGLREDLEGKGHTFSSNSDTEVLVHGWEEYGVSLPQLLNGMFAFAIYDSNKKQLFLARDRLGIKPLYYSQLKDKFVFASEIKSILQHPDIRPSLDASAFKDFAAIRFVSGTNTLFAGVNKIAPASYLVISKKGVESKCYWRLQENIKEISTDEAARNIRLLLEESVRARLMSDVPLGAFLSGGVDSSAMVGLLSQEVDEPVKTFSVGFGEHADNELPYARIVAEHFATEHTEVTVDDNVLKELPQMLWHLDEPIADAAIVPTYIVSREAKRKVTVVLAGEGGDEVFAGYRRYKIMMVDHMLGKIIPPGVTRTIAVALKPLFAESTNLRRAINFFSLNNHRDKYLQLMGLRDDDEWLEEGKVSADRKIQVKKGVEKLLSEAGDWRFLNRVLYLDVKNILAEDYLMKADKMTMAHGLEERVPILDHRLVEYAMTLPPQLKLNFGREKYVWRKAINDLLPKSIIGRRKRGYNVPTRNWLQGELGDMLGQLIDQTRSRKDTLFDYSKAERVLEKVRGKKGGYYSTFYMSTKLWAILSFELWRHIYLSEETPKIPKKTLAQII